MPTIPRLAAVPVAVAVLLAGCSAPEATPADADAAATTAPAADPTATTAPAADDATPTPAELVPMTFMAGFQPQANLPFVGVYVADDRGFFAEEGLDVQIEHSAGGGEHLQLLTAGTVDVTTQDAAVLLERRVDPGLPLVSLALLGQTGQQAFVAMADSGLETPADWAGATVGFKGTPPPDLFAMLDAVGLAPDDLDLVNVGFDPRVLPQGQVDVLPVYKSNEPNLLASMGHDLVLWDPADYDVPTLGLTWVATEQAVAERPDDLDAFVDAAMRGVAWAAEHPDQAVDIVMEHAGEGADPDHQRFMLDTELADAQSAVTDEHGLGWQTTEQYQALADLLVETGAIEGDPDVAGAYTNQFLEE